MPMPRWSIPRSLMPESLGPDAVSRTSRPHRIRLTPLASRVAIACVMASLALGHTQAAPPAVAVPELAITSITARQMDAHLRFLTNDLLEGRVVGHRGNELAEIYIASVLERLGLQGVNVTQDSPYYQPFEMIGAVRAPGNKVVLREGPSDRDSANTYEIGLDFAPVNISAVREVTGNIVFAGYGITAPNLGYDDYRGVDAKGKIVVVLDGSGKLAATESTPTSKALAAQTHGAAGLIIVGTVDGNRTWPEQVSPKVNRFILPERAAGVDIPVGNISVKLADVVLAGGVTNAAAAAGAQPAGNRSVERLRKSLDETRAPVSFDVPGRRLTLGISFTRRHVTVRNLLAVMEGSDSILKNELVVIGAHFDANGIDHKGLIYTGADDDGSGTAAVLAVAEAFVRAAEAGARPRRTVVFALWNAEEKGRGGSITYANHPLPASGKIAVNINLDHVGRNEENIDTSDPRFKGFPLMTSQQNANVLHLLGYSFCPDVATVVMEENATIGLTVKADYDQHVSNLVQRSDHWSFLSKGIPAVFLHTGLHPDYHMPTDTIEKINFPKLEKIAKLAFRVVWRLASQAEKPQPPKQRATGG